MSGASAVIKKKVREPTYHSDFEVDLSPDPTWVAMYNEEMRKRSQGKPAEGGEEQAITDGEGEGKKNQKGKGKGKGKGKEKEKKDKKERQKPKCVIS
ncbi:hypothetical protein FGG08_005072 [Glutinoglossum americanum]|uniref:Uncharacterized protein n=1 Tax=Glutinoglossum americanum TaxID=1670608 RepID=A0A9P8L252_9PEZI|nr:hypothetical protein FGG08_005072 [Glutinoglossum americanum]